MKTIRLALLFLFGVCLISFAVFAFNLGLDPSPAWGKSRTLAFSVGVLLLAMFADLRFGRAWTEKLEARLVALRQKTLHGTRVSQSLRNTLVYILVILSFLGIIGINIWFATAGTWNTLPTASDYFNILANAFIHGQVSIDYQVDPRLLALPDPYNVEAREGIDFLWDAVFHDGKYYLYWGPMPAILIAAVKLFRPLDVGDHIVSLAVVVGLVLFQTLLLTRIWMRFFQRFPAWTLLLGIFLCGLAIPITWMLQRSNVYEASILCGQAFLMGGVYFAWRAFEGTEVSPGWLAWSSVFWVFAIASRTIVILVVVFFILFILVGILHRHGLRWTPRINALILAIGLPMILGAIGMGWYNAVRFGSIFDFGLDYMLTSHNNHEFRGSFFSSGYIAANTYSYLLNPPQRIQPFPYFRATAWDETQILGSAVPELYYAEKVTGLVYALPFAIFAFIPALQILSKGLRSRGAIPEAEQFLEWFNLALSGGTLIAGAYLLVYYYGTMRYLADVTSMLVVLSVIGFWIGYRFVASDWFVRFVYAGVGIILAGISVIVPNMLALLSSQNFNVYSPRLLPALDALFKSIFSS